MARSEYEITHAAIRYATACMLDGNWHALREMGFGHRECDALQDLTLADLAALERRRWSVASSIDPESAEARSSLGVAIYLLRIAGYVWSTCW